MIQGIVESILVALRRVQNVQIAYFALYFSEVFKRSFISVFEADDLRTVHGYHLILERRCFNSRKPFRQEFPSVKLFIKEIVKLK